MDDLKNKKEQETAIGGWLILVLIGLIVTPIRLGISTFTEFLPLLDSLPFLKELYPKLVSIIYVELFSNIAFGIFALFLIFVMVMKNKIFPKLMIIFYVSNLVFVLGDAIYISQMTELEGFYKDDGSIKEIVRAIVGTAIWVPYMLVSKRVKRTFVH